MKRVVAYVDELTHERLHILKRTERRSMSAVAGAILEAALSDRNGEHWQDAPGADRGTRTPGAEGPESDGGADASASPGSPRRPGPVERAIAKRREQ